MPMPVPIPLSALGILSLSLSLSLSLFAPRFCNCAGSAPVVPVRAQAGLASTAIRLALFRLTCLVAGRPKLAT